MLSFTLVFAVALPVTYLLDKAVCCVVKNKIASFLLLHTLLLGECVSGRLGDDALLWWVLTVLHGLAHIAHPAFYGEKPNANYTPFYDYIIHSFQCLTISFYNPQWLVYGIAIHTMMIAAAIVAHLDKKYLETPMWLLFSSGGVFGTHFHMMLIINELYLSHITYSSLFIWTAPYFGYLLPLIGEDRIPQWDKFVNELGLFRMWYFNFFIAYIAYTKLVPL
jgi:hypothetical protein